MAADADRTRALDRLQVAMANHARALRKLERAELERARAVLDARAAGMTTAAIGRVLGTSHVRVVQLSRWAEEKGLAGGTRSDPSATARGAPEPTPVGVLLARALEVTAEQPDPSATSWEAECAEFGCHEEPDPSVTAREVPERTFEEIYPPSLAAVWPHTEPDPSAIARPCARRGCRGAAIAGGRFCETHARY